MDIASLQKTAQTLRREAVRMIYEGNDGHPGPALSIADIVTVLFFQEMRLNPADPAWENRDRFLLSKGHSCPIYYAALNERGYFQPKVEHFGLRQLGSIFQGHPSMHTTPGVDMTSNPATVAAIGGICAPRMIQKGYPPETAAAIAASSGTLGVVIPPSIPMVTYAVTAGVTVIGMFQAGWIPGIMLIIGLCITNIILCRKFDSVDTTKYSAREYAIRFKDAILALLMPFIILGGIYAGVFTPTESAAVACVYALIISIFVFKNLMLKSLYKIFVDSCISSAVVLFVVSMSAPFAWFMTSENIPTMISSAVMNAFSNKYLILLVMNLLLLFLGCFLETQSIILLVTPILLPMATAIGVSPIALGLIIIVNTSIGMITPPMAVNLFVASGICKTTIGAVSKKIIPYLIVEFCILLLYTYMPILLNITI
ncbi:MAG: TRAP transporter large permease subunit [Lawsonibacter sp.]|nr:TRAP transporter large permease subunit [Lawsonibacter sp.]